MPLLDNEVRKHITVVCSLEESTVIQANQYAAMLNNSGEAIVNKALKYLFAKDKDFQRFMEAHPHAKSEQPLKVKKPIVVAKKEKAPRKQTLAIAQ